MIYHTLFFTKIRKDVAKFVAAAVVIGALRSKEIEMYIEIYENLWEIILSQFF